MQETSEEGEEHEEEVEGVFSGGAMKLFIWEQVGKVSGNYHCGGGLVIVDESLESAAASWLKYCYDNDLKSDMAADESTGLGPPDATYETPNAEQRIFVFPDAGCC